MSYDLIAAADGFRLGTKPTDDEVDRANSLLSKLTARIRQLEAENAALREKAQGVKVKPLEWEQGYNGPRFEYSTNGGYQVYYTGSNAETILTCGARRVFIGRFAGDVIGRRARHAAQADHERRIRSALTPAPVSVGDGVAAIAAERQRQMDVEGWTPEHDDKHIRGEMGAVAACYAVPSRDRLFALDQFWPPTWDYSWWKPTGAHDDLTARRRDLVKAGALIAAEIDRLDRAALRALAGEEK